jgi:hypothetical protein
LAGCKCPGIAASLCWITRKSIGALARVNGKVERELSCLYFNTAPMVAGMRSYLAASGVDVVEEIEKSALVLSSDQAHLQMTFFVPPACWQCWMRQ